MAKATSLVSADSALASVETTSVPIGCPVIVNIDIASASSDFVPPSALTLSFPDWEVCESQRLQLPSQGSQQRWRYRVALQGWQLGKQTIPPLEIGGLTTSPLTVEITRPEGTSLALSAALPWEAWRERFGNPLALGAAALAALLAIGGVWEVARYQRRPERAIPRQVCTDLMRAQTLGEEGWALAEKAVRVYLTWKLAIGEQELTLKELAALAEPAWAELLTELEARKYRAEREDGACQSWVGRALALATPSQEGGK